MHFLKLQFKNYPLKEEFLNHLAMDALQLHVHQYKPEGTDKPKRSISVTACDILTNTLIGQKPKLANLSLPL